MENKYKGLIRKLFKAYLNDELMEYKLDFKEYDYLSYNKLDMAFFSVWKDNEERNPELIRLFQIKRNNVRTVNRLYHSEVDKLFLDFEKSDIEYVFLKGWACLIGLYRNLEDRYFADIDILV